jgi:pyruvate dehydrogenase E1 component alpha subunit
MSQRQESGVDVEHWLHAYRQMAKIREFEEKVNELYLNGIMPGLAHLYSGQEAIAVGVCEALRPDDYITSTTGGTDTASPRARR